MYLSDMSPHTCDGPLKATVLSIGWLDEGHDFARGEVPSRLVEKLRWYATKGSVGRSRGYHECQLCKPEPQWVSIPDPEDPLAHPYSLGSSEIWIPAPEGDRWFAAPDLIYHYVIEHGYRPPDEFLRALEAMPLRTDLQAEYLKLFKPPVW